MFNAQITYHPNRLTRFFYLFRWSVFCGKKPVVINRALPQKWDELKSHELIALAKSRFLIDQEKSKRMYFLFRLLKLPIWIFDQMPADDAAKIYEHVSKLMGDNVMMNWPIKQIEKAGMKWQGPSDRGGNICFLEFINADKFYNKFLKSQNMQDLNCLVATLYRPIDEDLNESDPKYKGDLRLEFNEHLIEHYAAIVSRFPEATKYAILLNYSGFRKWIETRYPLTFATKEKAKASKFGLLGVLQDVAGPKFGDDEQTAAKPLHAILVYIESSHQKLEDAE